MLKFNKKSFLSLSPTLLLVVYFLTGAFLSITSPYPMPTTTRSFLLLPFGFYFAAKGLNEMTVLIHQKTHKYILALIFVSVVVLNYQKENHFFEKANFSREAFALKQIQEHIQNHPSERIFYLASKKDALGKIVPLPKEYGLGLFDVMVTDIYQLGDVSVKLYPKDGSEPVPLGKIIEVKSPHPQLAKKYGLFFR